MGKGLCAQLLSAAEATAEARPCNETEVALRESEARYRRIIDGLTDYQYTVRIEDGRAVETLHSLACEKVTGYTAEEFSSHSDLWIQMVAPEDRESVSEHVRQILAGKDVPPLEYRIIRKDGELRWMMDTTILFRDASGKLLSYDGVIKDITGLKQADAAFRAIVESSTASSGMDFFRKTVSNLCEWLGVECAIIGEITDENKVRALSMQLDGKAVDHYEYLLTGAPCGDVVAQGYCLYPESICRLFPADQDLSGMDAEAYAGIPIKDQDGRPVGVLCIISRHKIVPPPMLRGALETIAVRAGVEIGRLRAEQALRDERDLSQRYLATTMALMVALDREGNITMINPAATSLLGYSGDELLGRNWFATCLPQPEGTEIVLPLFRKIISGDFEKRNTFENSVLCRDGSQRVIAWSNNSMTDADGRIVGVLSSGMDITERRRSEQRLAESEAYFRSLFENMLEGYAYCRMIYDGDIPEDWIYLDTNPSFEKLTGLKNVIGSRVSEIIPGLRESNPELFEIYGRVVRTGVPEQFEIHVSALNTWFAVSAFRPEQECFVAVFDNITARKADEEKIRRLSQLYAALSLCNESIIRSNDEAELFPQVCRAAVQHGGMMMAWIGLLDVTSKLVRPVACYGEGTAFLHGIRISIDAEDPHGRGPTGTAIREDMPFWCQDYQHDPATGPWHERGAQYGWRASASLPLRRKGAVVGNLTLYADTINAFDDDARKLLVEMASDISFALNNFAYEAERKQSLKLLEEREQHFRAITESANDAIITTAASADNIVDWNAAAERIFGYTKNEVVGQPLLRLIPERYRKQHSDGLAQLVAGGLPRIIGKTVEFFGLRKDGSEFPLELSLSQWESGHGMYFTAVIRDISARKQAELLQQHSEQRFHILIEQSIAGAYIIQDGKFIYLNPRFYEIHGFEESEGLLGSNPMEVVAAKDRSLVANYMSALLDGKMHGVSYIYTALRKDGSSVEVGANSSQAYFQERPAIIGLMQDISDKKVAEEQIKRYAAQLQITFMQTVGLATTLSEMRDPYTAGHERRVADIAVAIGVEMGLDAQQLEGLKVGGYLHDVGKTAIPIEVLVKPGRFTPVEYEMVKSHARSGYDVLKEVEFPWPVAQMAFQHHERMDGSGYPQGLKGEDILLEARILAVADVVEAMASHRPYRPGLGINVALAEIERGCGSAYDPAAAAACLRLFHEKGYVLPGD